MKTLCGYLLEEPLRGTPNENALHMFSWRNKSPVGQKLLPWIRMIMICYIVPLWPSWLSDEIAFSSSESDVVWSFKIVSMAAILDIGTERFSNSESPCHHDASHQVSAQPDLLFEKRCSLKNFKMVAILEIGPELF